MRFQGWVAENLQQEAAGAIPQKELARALGRIYPERT
jgi:hypothetical protein